MCDVIQMSIGSRKINIAEIKKDYIANIIDAARKCDLIDRVVLFGSSRESRCEKSSDIDLAVFGNKSSSRALSSKQYERFARQLYSFRDHEQAYDIIYFKTGSKSDSLIMNDISAGEVLYERGE